MHAFIAVHDTPDNSAEADPDGLGVLTFDQTPPYHQSSSVASAPEEPTAKPTAMQMLRDAHETPARNDPGSPGGLWVTCSDDVFGATVSARE